MALKELKVIERNGVFADVTNALTDNTNEKIISNELLQYSINEDSSYTTSVLELLNGGGFNSPSLTIDNYPNYVYNIGYYKGSSNIVITFKKPVRDFFITIVNKTYYNLDVRNDYNPLGSIKVYDADGVIIKGVRPALPGTSQEIILENVKTSTPNIVSTANIDTIRTVNNSLVYQFGVTTSRKRITKVLLEAPNDVEQILIYQSIDFDTPLPPQASVPNSIIDARQANDSLLQTTQLGGNADGRNYYNSVYPNPHIHYVDPNPHTHDITPNPHRHAMRFAEEGSYLDISLENSCRVGPETLINLIYNELNTETEKEKSRVSEAAKKGNWVTANKIGKPIWDYLENYYIRRIICYLQARSWYTEYETLNNIPTNLDVLPSGLILSYNGNNIVGPQGSRNNTVSTTTIDAPSKLIYCAPQFDSRTPNLYPSYDCSPYQVSSCSDISAAHVACEPNDTKDDRVI